MKRTVLAGVVLSPALLWLDWPWIAPLVSPVPTSATDSDLVVYLDDFSDRLAVADRIGHALPPRSSLSNYHLLPTRFQTLRRVFRHLPSNDG